MNNDKFARVHRVSAESLLKHTGKDWQQWHDILSKQNAKNWTHQEIVQYLKTKRKLSVWWQQIVATGFEILVGNRQEGRNAKGDFSITVTKTIHASVNSLWKFIISPAGYHIWLKPLTADAEFLFNIGNQFETEDGYFGQVRTLSKGKHIRMSWQDPDWRKKSYVTIHVHSQSKDKAMLVISHNTLSDGRLRTPLRERWQNAVNQIHADLSRK